MTDCYVWDFTLKYCEDHSSNILKDNLREIGKKWAFQLEEGDSGYQHWQGRLSLRTKKTRNPLVKLFNNVNADWHGVSLRPTAGCNTSNFNYVMKAESRIDGPWTDKDPIIFETKQMSLFDKWGLLKWQQSLKDIASIFDLRTIDLIYDEEGNSGKSLFSEHMEYCGIAEEVPPYRLMDDIFQWVCTRPIKQCYIFDMPRGMKKDKLADFYSGIEVIKNGVAYDKRHRATKVRFDRPRIFVFTNTLPQFNLMSKDRWKVWTIKNEELKHYDYEFIESDED